MPADLYVVGNLDQIIYFCALSNHRDAKGAAINRGVASHFDVIPEDHLPELREFVVLVFGKDVPEPVGADHHARVQQHPVSDSGARIEDNAGVEHAVFPHDDAPAQAYSGRQHRPRADRYFGLDHHLRTNAHVSSQVCAGPNHRGGMNSGRGPPGRYQNFRGANQGELGMCHRQRGVARHHGTLGYQNTGGATS